MQPTATGSGGGHGEGVPSGVSAGGPLTTTLCWHKPLSCLTLSGDAGFVYRSVGVGLIKTRKLQEAEAQVKRREVYRTVVTTQYEAIQAMTELAVVNCQIYGRNALNLKVGQLCNGAVSVAWEIVSALGFLAWFSSQSMKGIFHVAIEISQGHTQIASLVLPVLVCLRSRF